MIKVLRPFCLGEHEESAKLNVSSLLSNNLNAKDAKTKKHALELELIKMQQELLELELKYGEVKVELPEDEPTTPQQPKPVEKQVVMKEE